MPRSLAASLGQSFTKSSRLRGESYFWDGRVSETVADGGTFSAAVHGTRRYQATLKLEGNRLIAECTCPYFVDVGEPCKHTWAVILAADEAKAFTVPSDVRLDVRAGLVFGDLDEYSRGVLDSERHARPTAQRQVATPTSTPPWKSFLRRVSTSAQLVPAHAIPRGELIYVLDLERSAQAGGLVVEILTRERKKSGEWGKPKPVSIDRHAIARLPDADDRRLLDAIVGAAPAYAHSAPSWSGYQVGFAVPSAVVLSVTLQRDLAPVLCETGRLLVPTPAAAGTIPTFVPVDWEPTPSTFRLRVMANGDSYRIDGTIDRGGAEHPLDDVMFVTSALILWRPTESAGHPRLAAFNGGNAERWIEGLLPSGSMTIPATESETLAEALALADLARVACPDALRVETRSALPRPVLRIKRHAAHGGYSPSFDRLDATLTFAYGNADADAWSDAPMVFDRERRVAFRRDRSAERDAISRLPIVGVRMMANWESGGTRLDLAESSLPTIVRALVKEGWRVEAEGRVYRSAGAAALEVRSGIDWFELHGSVDFGGVTADLPALLAAVRRREQFVRLSDGSLGLLPEEWLARTGRLAAIGTLESAPKIISANRCSNQDGDRPRRWPIADRSRSSHPTPGYQDLCDWRYSRSRGSSPASA